MSKYPLTRLPLDQVEIGEYEESAKAFDQVLDSLNCNYRELAKVMGVSKTSVVSYRAGRSRAKTVALERLYQKTGIDIRHVASDFQPIVPVNRIKNLFTSNDESITITGNPVLINKVKALICEIPGIVID